MCVCRASRCLVRFIRAVCSEHIKYSLHTEDFRAAPVIHIHPAAHNQTEAKTNTEHGLVNTCVTCELPLPSERLWNQLPVSLSLLPPFFTPFTLQIHFSLLRSAIPTPLLPFQRSLSTPSPPPPPPPPPPGESTTLPSSCCRGLLCSSSFLLSPPSCEIAVVSYGFLFLRDGRWVHVGVEATKHAASARRAGQHTQRASRGFDSCHVHISGLPIIKNVHTVKIEDG